MKRDFQIGTDVKPFRGVDSLLLGISRDKVKDIIGAPTNKRIESEDSNSSEEYWDYEDYGVTLSFSSDDEFRLGSITFRHRSFTILGEEVIGLSESELMAKVSRGCLPKIEVEQVFSELDATNYECCDYGITLWRSGSLIENFTMYPKYGNTGETPIWP